MLDTDSQTIDTAETSMSHAFAKAGYTFPGIDPYDVDVGEPRHYSSPTAAICDHAALLRRHPQPGRDRQSLRLGRGRGHRRHRTDGAHADPERRPGRHAARRRARAAAVGLREHAARPGAAHRPDRRPDRPADARPRARPGRHRGEGRRAGTPHRPRPRSRPAPRRVREDARLRHRRLPHRDRPGLAAAPRVAHLADPQAHLGRHRRPRLPARTEGTRDPARTCRTVPSSPSRAGRTSPTPTQSGPRWTARARSTATWCCSTAAARATRRSRRAGRTRAASTRWCAARTGTRTARPPPFRRNDELLNLLPKGVIAFPGSGITGNLVDKARQLGIPVMTVAA